MQQISNVLRSSKLPTVSELQSICMIIKMSILIIDSSNINCNNDNRIINKQ